MGKNLPAEVLLNIFRRLLVKQLRETILFVCKDWYKVVRNSSLVKINVNLRRPYDYHFGNLLNDLKQSPGFASSVKTLSIEDRDEIRPVISFTSDKLQPLVQACTKLEEMKICTGNSQFYKQITDGILECKNEFHSSFTSLDFDLHYPRSEEIMVVLTKLVNDAPSTLQQLYFQAPIGRNIFFVTSNLLHHNTSLLRTLRIVCPEAVMTKACLEYLISGQLTHLEDLDLFISLVRQVGDPNTYISSVDVSDEVFERLKDFCSSSLKNYNIAFTYYLSNHYLFSIDNCKYGQLKFSDINKPLLTVYIPPPGHHDNDLVDTDSEFDEE